MSIPLPRRCPTCDMAVLLVERDGETEMVMVEDRYGRPRRLHECKENR